MSGGEKLRADYLVVKPQEDAVDTCRHKHNWKSFSLSFKSSLVCKCNFDRKRLISWAVRNFSSFVKSLSCRCRAATSMLLGSRNESRSASAIIVPFTAFKRMSSLVRSDQIYIQFLPSHYPMLHKLPSFRLEILISLLHHNLLRVYF